MYQHLVLNQWVLIYLVVNQRGYGPIYRREEMEDTQDLHHQQQLQHQEQQAEPAYCDYIAHITKNALNAPDPLAIVYGAGRIHWDLSPEGQFLSTKKHLFVVDCNGRHYKITVEEV